MAHRLSTNVIANVAHAGSGLVVAAVSTPLIIGALGQAAFGIWTLVASLMLYVTLAESGFGPAVQRFVAVAHGQADRRTAARIMWTVVLAYLVVGALVCVALQLVGGPLVDVFDFPPRYRDQAVELLRLVGVATPVALVAIGLGNVLYGLERFVVGAISSAFGAATLLVAIVVVITSGGGLPGLGVALLAQQVVLLLIRAHALRDVAAAAPPALVRRDHLREMLSFSARLQVSAMSVLINGQSDKVVVGLVAPATTIAQLGVASQVAEAGRLIGGAMLPPIISRLAVVATREGHDTLAAEYRRFSRVWIVAVTGATGVGLGMLHPLLVGWLGDGFHEAAVLGSILVIAYGINVVTGIGSAYLRATGVIGLEARAGAYMVLLNAVLTIPLALAFGARGVVVGTLGANVFGTTWFFWRLHRLAPFLPSEPWLKGARYLAVAAVCGAGVLGVGELAVAALPRFFSLVPVGIAAAAGLAVYLSVALDVPLRPRLLRNLVRGGTAREA